MAISSFEIVSVPVSDQQRAKQFYRDVLGFDSVAGGTHGAGRPMDGNGWILRQPPGG